MSAAVTEGRRFPKSKAITIISLARASRALIFRGFVRCPCDCTGLVESLNLPYPMLMPANITVFETVHKSYRVAIT